LERIGFIVFFVLFGLPSQAQLEFNNSIFPVAGDSLNYQKDVLNISDVFTPGENLTWDYRFLQTPLFEEQRYTPSAFYKLSSQSGKTFTYPIAGMEYIFVSDRNGLEEIGFLLQSNPSGRKVPVYYDKPLSWDASTLSYQQRKVLKSDFSYTLKRSDLPEEVAQDIPSSIDDFLVKGSKTSVRDCDAWGSLMLPGETLKVNRVRVSTTVKLRIYHAKTGKLIPYFDDDMIRKIIPMKAKFRTYEFYSKDYPFITAQIEVTDKNILSNIKFQSRKTSSRRINTTSGKNDFTLYPNPTYNIAKIFINNRSKGNYSLAVYNIIGKKLWERNITVDGETIIKENFAFLPKGTYLISLLDENGNILRTTRLIIVSV
jgi:hypothetical protein